MAMTLEQLQTLSAAELQAAVKDGSADIGDVLAEMDRRTTAAEQAAEQARAAAKASNGRTIKVNSSGGLYVRDPSFKCWSGDKSKEYTGGVNLDPDLARALFGNPDLCKAVHDYLQATGLTKYPKKSAATVTVPPADVGNTGQAAAAALVTSAPLAGRTRNGK